MSASEEQNRTALIQCRTTPAIKRAVRVAAAQCDQGVSAWLHELLAATFPESADKPAEGNGTAAVDAGVR